MPPSSRNPSNIYVTFSDFSAGIVQRTGIVGALSNSPAKIGSASITNTYRCISLPGGGLGPLPKRVRDISATWVTPGDSYIVTGFKLFGPVYESSTHPALAPFGPDFPPYAGNTPFEIHLLFNQYEAPDTAGVWLKIRAFSDGGYNTIQTFNYGSGSISHNASYPIITRLNPTFPNSYGCPVVVASMGPIENALGTFRNISAYPDPTAPGTNAVSSIIGRDGPLIGHQNRIVMLFRESIQHGANGANEIYAVSNEAVGYTDVNNISIAGSPSVFGQEDPVGYGAWGSITSSDLLLIKHSGGGILIQGDISYPVVRRLSGVPSTGGTECIGANSTIGFVYGINAGGVFAWQGGDGAKNLSPQLEDGFWISSVVQNYIFRGGFLGWGNWVLTPNNFLLDTNTGGWWKIEDNSFATYFIWERDPINNVVYGCRPTFGSDHIYTSGYDARIPASNYSWQSQPFSFQSQSRIVDVRSMRVITQGVGTITVTITSIDGTTPNQPSVITNTGSSPNAYRRSLHSQGSQFIIRIVADNGSSPAPVIYGVEFEAQERSQLPTI